MIHFTSRQIVSDLVQSCHQITLSHFKTYRINCHFYESFHFITIHSTCVVFLVVTAAHIFQFPDMRNEIEQYGLSERNKRPIFGIVSRPLLIFAKLIIIKINYQK